MSKPLINILIRSGKRRELLLRCLKSIQVQTYKNIRIIISTDAGMSNIPAGFEVIEVVPQQQHLFFYNLYCNELKEKVKEGWFFFLDDDDYLVGNKAIETMANYLTDPDEAVICQFLRGGIKKPTNEEIKKRQILSGRIGMPCIFVNAKQKDTQHFGYASNADYVYIKEISNKIKTKFIPNVVVCADIKSRGK